MLEARGSRVTKNTDSLVSSVRYCAAISIALSIITGFGLRLYRPAADPPAWSYVYNTDEGHYSYNTHNKINYGHWFVNEAKYALIAPLFNLAQYLVAAGLPNQSNIVRYRAISIVSGVLFCFALQYLFRQPCIKWAAVALGSLSFMAVVHSRLGIPEMMLTLLSLVTALLAMEGEKRQSLVLYIATGAAAVACAAIKPIGILMLIVLITVPALCRTMRGHRKTYFSGLGAGVLLSGLAFSLFVVIPYYTDWLKMLSVATAIGRDSVKPELLGLLGSLWLFLLSPAMQTMPLLWPLALCWCLGVFLPRLKHGENDFEETLLFLWLCFGIVMLGLPSYQPARWQLLIFPPVIAAGLRLLLHIRTPVGMVCALVLAVLLAVMFPLVHGGGLLRVGGEIRPAYGVFSHIVTFAIASAAFLLAVFAVRICHMGWRTGILWGALFLELSVQMLLHNTYMKPTYGRESQWIGCANALERLNQSANDLFAGSMVQDLSLRADIRVLPTYYVLNEKQLDDRALQDFFHRQNASPAYFVLLDSEHRLWTRKAPLFMSRLEAMMRCELFIGDLGFRKLYVYRLRPDIR